MFAKIYLSGNSLLLILDDLFSGRFKLAAYALNNSGLTFFTNYIDYIGVVNWDNFWELNKFTFDSVYSFAKKRSATLSLKAVRFSKFKAMLSTLLSGIC